MITTHMEGYKERAIRFGQSMQYVARQPTRAGAEGYKSGELVKGGLVELQQRLFFSRE
jgi:hypothetical protein